MKISRQLFGTVFRTWEGISHTVKSLRADPKLWNVVHLYWITIPHPQSTIRINSADAWWKRWCAIFKRFISPLELQYSTNNSFYYYYYIPQEFARRSFLALSQDEKWFEKAKNLLRPHWKEDLSIDTHLSWKAEIYQSMKTERLTHARKIPNWT